MAHTELICAGQVARLRLGYGALLALLIAGMILASCQPVMPVEELIQSSEQADVVALPTVTPKEVEAETIADESLVIDEEAVTAGMAVYRAQYCGICHAFTAAETTGHFGPSHDGAALNAESRLQDPRYAGEAATAAEYLYESLVQPGAYFVEGYVGTSHSMPPYSHLPEEDLQALVALLLAQR